MNSADAAAWLGAAGTWAVGVVAAVIAARQYRESQFRPVAFALLDSDPEGRYMVYVTNRTSGAGTVNDVNFLGRDHGEKGLVEAPLWEIDGRVSWAPPLPFALGPHATAQLCLRRSTSDELLGLRIRVEYGDGTDSGCLDVGKVGGRLYGSTLIPGLIGLAPAPSRRRRVAGRRPGSV